MTLLQIAQNHCANWQTDGSCLGAVIDDDLQIRRCVPKPKCVLATLGSRCLYFEECVAPNVRHFDGRYREQFEETLRAYRLAANLPSACSRLCPECRRPIEPRRRFCAVCAAARRRATYRLATAKRREGIHMSTVKVISIVAPQGVTEPVFGDQYGDSGQGQNRQLTVDNKAAPSAKPVVLPSAERVPSTQPAASACEKLPGGGGSRATGTGG